MKKPTSYEQYMADLSLRLKLVESSLRYARRVARA